MATDSSGPIDPDRILDAGRCFACGYGDIGCRQKFFGLVFVDVHDSLVFTDDGGSMLKGRLAVKFTVKFAVNPTLRPAVRHIGIAAMDASMNAGARSCQR